MQTTACFHASVTNAILQEADFVFHDPVACHPANGMFNPDADGRDPTIRRLLRGCEFPTTPLHYGERYHHGEGISTSFVESTVNQVVNKRMVKKQQMQWTTRGAHLLLQIHTRALNDEWEAPFLPSYPGFRSHTRRVAA